MYCKNCGKEIGNAKFCPECGHKVEASLYPDPPMKKQKKKSLGKGCLTSVLVFIVLVLVLGAIFGNTGDSDAIDETLPKTETTVSTSSSLAEDSPETISTTYAPSVNSTSVAESNALRAAKNYLAFTAFSYNGLIKQLEFEGYTTEEATYAVDNCGADWDEQALKSANNYLSFTAFSYTGLIKQLEYEQYTTEQATYAADNCGADWKEQAAKAAKNYVDMMPFSRSSLIEQLKYEGYTDEQAAHGADSVGLT